MKKILIVIGSASKPSANLQLVRHLTRYFEKDYSITVFEDLKALPHFDPELSVTNPPENILAFRNLIAQSHGVIICTPEYIFSVPSGLKNVLEWCVATTVFSGKVTGIITASAHGVKGHEELQLIMKTIGAEFEPDTTLLIQGIKGKVDASGAIADQNTRDALQHFANKFKALLNKRL